MNTSFNPEVLESAVIKISKKIKSNNVKTWTEFKEHELWCELVFCILGSRVKYELTKATVDKLKNQGFLDINLINLPFFEYEAVFRDALQKPLEYETLNGRIIGRYPFPFIKASQITKTAFNIYKRTTINEILKSSTDPISARYSIIINSVGIGPKQSSLFLRSIGYIDDFAIFDLHVLRYMYLIGLLKKEINSISNLTLYEKLESEFINYAKKLKLSVAILDMAIWVVMRVFQREYAR